MNLIICLDTKNGYSFASRRQSRDRIQLKKMLDLVGDKRLFLNEYSSKLFEETPSNVTVCDNPLKAAKEGDFCFVENLDVDNVKAEKIIIYRWNRHYPSDKIFTQNLLCDKVLVSAEEFVGNSHEKITQEVYE